MVLKQRGVVGGAKQNDPHIFFCKHGDGMLSSTGSKDGFKAVGRLRGRSPPH